jgi:hypothetical protein
LDPQPLQQPRRELEIELEGFTEDSLSDETAGGQTPTEIQPVGYQQAAEFQSYASQQYAPQGDRPTATSVVEPPTQLVSPALRPSGMPAASGFQVEPVLGNAGSTPELELPPVDANEAWREADAVPHPEGTRVARGTAAGARPAVPAASANYIRPRRHAQDLPPVGGQTPEESLPPARSGLGNRLPLQDDFDQEYGPAMKSCEELRRELLGVTLRDISLDLSTPTSTIPADEAGYPIRDWRDPNNQVLLRGRAVAATMSEIRILDESGVERSLPLSQLGATDQKYAWDVMDLPFECNVVSDITYCRSFAPTHVSWHASNLCHKPLYFEDIQLERYGHTVGPIRQPVKSALRFLGQAALLPYQMSLAPPNECQYPLGLFRPGNCAPYLRTPFPWERRAVGYQAGVTAGLFLLVP